MFEFRGLVGLAPALGGPGAFGWAQDVGGAPAVAVWCAVGLHGCFVLFCVVLCDGLFFFGIGFALLRCCVVGASPCFGAVLLRRWLSRDRPSFLMGEVFMHMALTSLLSPLSLGEA